MTYILDIPYTVISYDEYDWLVFSRKVLFVLAILLGTVAYIRQRAPPVITDEKKE